MAFTAWDVYRVFELRWKYEDTVECVLKRDAKPSSAGGQVAGEEVRIEIARSRAPLIGDRYVVRLEPEKARDELVAEVAKVTREQEAK